jgi:exopolyphosphatase/guanosine-5'-triphosphate,3'-diphosphate pyrophosphatase
VGIGPIAAIDVGSSATRLVIAKKAPLGFTTLYRSRAPIRLGTEVFGDGAIGPESRAQLVAAFREIARRLKAYHVVRYCAVATSALRDARNGSEVLAHIEKNSGLAVRLISGEEEARLMHDALLAAMRRHHLPPPPHKALLLDLGGGSLELMRVDGSEARSLPLGTVRLLAQHPRLAGPMSAHDVVSMSERFSFTLREHVGTPPVAEMALGTGGNVEAMAQRMPAQSSSPLPNLSIDALLPAACALGPLSVPARARAYGLHHGRADLLLPALLIVHAVGRLFGLDRILVPGAGIRDALLEGLWETGELTP